jgi:hypothetical protein
MSRRTVKLTAPNGATVRTVNSKRYFVVHYGATKTKYNHATREYDRFDTPQQFAHVDKRTDSALTAHKEADGRPHVVVFEVVGGEPTMLDLRQLGWTAASEKAARKAGLSS